MFRIVTRITLVAAGAVVLTIAGLALWRTPLRLPEAKPPAPPGRQIRVELVQIPNEEAPDVAAEERKVKEPSSWCASPRRNEPLRRYAVEMGTASEKSRSGFERRMNGIKRVPRSSIVIVKDETICRDAAMVYNSLHGEMDAVLVIRIDTRYLVGNLEFQPDDPAAYWHVEIYDERWRHLGSYSQGA